MVQTAEIEAMLRSGMKYLEITEKTGVSSATIAKISKAMQAGSSDPQAVGVQVPTSEPIQLLTPEEMNDQLRANQIQRLADWLPWCREFSRLLKKVSSAKPMSIHRAMAWFHHQPPGP